MLPQQVEHLFEPFSSTTGGTGLGLSIVYQIIRDHGGTINVRSRENLGTTIAIELPAEQFENGSDTNHWESKTISQTSEESKYQESRASS
jgi:signal transduction histidine kinase